MTQPRTPRSRKASPKVVKAARRKMSLNGWNQEDLALEANMSPTTVGKFLSGTGIDKTKFQEICFVLEINADEIDRAASPASDDSGSLDELVLSLRKQVSTQIQNRCGTMRVLDMTKPIGLDTIYTDVNILERITAKRGHHEVLKKLTPKTLTTSV